MGYSRIVVGAVAGTVAVAAAAGGILALKQIRPQEGGCPVSAIVAEVLQGNERLFSVKDLALLEQLLLEGQQHLFKGWPTPGVRDSDKRRLVRQLADLDRHYPGGLAQYIRNAKQLLRDSKEGKNPFDGYTPAVPEGEKLDFLSPGFTEAEARGLPEAAKCAFVLVAGGLGERLGYSGIKVALPYESATATTFLALYCDYIRALQDRSGAAAPLPFAIMTSDDTHARTLRLLEEHRYFGLSKSQVHLLKQEKVACLADNDAHLALEPSDPFALQTKPHGHGDVHGLLHASGLARRWRDQGFKWICFFQDTNALVTKVLVAALGVSASRDYDMNSLAVPRQAKEAIGAIARLQHRDGRRLVINVEYNQLDPLLRSTPGYEGGDVNDSSGWSPFPGNINQLVLKLGSYVPALEASGGVISEFVNPKYKDESKTAFKSSTRLECMMQDYPRSLPEGARVGFTVVNQVWASYSPVKNSPADAAAKAKAHAPTHSATAAEFDVYRTNAACLASLAGAEVPPPGQAVFNGIPVEAHPRVVLSPSFAPLLEDIKSKVQPGSIKLWPHSVLVLDGPDIKVEGPLEVAGALVVRAVPGARLTIGPLAVCNAGWVWEALPEGSQAPEEERIRGFKVVRKEAQEVVLTKPGNYVLGPSLTPVPAPK